ncbi:MAG: hypothetical protein AAGJ94_10305 [Pseudomonadota bacterium]
MILFRAAPSGYVVMRVIGSMERYVGFMALNGTFNPADDNEEADSAEVKVAYADYQKSIRMGWACRAPLLADELNLLASKIEQGEVSIDDLGGDALSDAARRIARIVNAGDTVDA